MMSMFRRRTLLAATAMISGSALLNTAALALDGADQPSQQQMPPESGDEGGAGHRPHHGPPFKQIAHDLNLPVERVRAAFRKVGRASTDGPPSAAQRAQHTQALAAELGVSVGQLRSVLAKYRRPPPSHS
jgi:Spy/CpxP family protein refolding chaperone